MVTREEITVQAEEWLARKDEIKQRFAEHVDTPTVEVAIGLSLVGAGLGTVVANLLRGKRSPWAYVLPAVFVLSGIAVVGSGAFSRRADRIAAAEDVISAQLAELDPIARAQVLRGVASDAFSPLIHHSAN